MKNLKISLGIALVCVSTLGFATYDFCKSNPDKNNGSCEQQCPGQVECVKDGGSGCYGHGNEELSIAVE